MSCTFDGTRDCLVGGSVKLVSYFAPLISDLDIFLSLPIVNSFPLPNNKKDVNDTNALLPKAFVKTSAKLKNVRIHANMMIPAAAASQTLW